MSDDNKSEISSPSNHQKQQAVSSQNSQRVQFQEKQPPMNENQNILRQQTSKIEDKSNYKEGTFITNVKSGQNNQNNPNDVENIYGQLNNFIEDLDLKIDGVIERHEAEFLIAYRNHMTKIRKELAEMKRKSDEQEKSFHANDRISGLEKQLSWFREESLKLYNKLEHKDKENDDLRQKIDDYKKEKIFLESQVKALLKKNKYLEVKIINIQRNSENQSVLNLLEQQQNLNNENLLGHTNTNKDLELPQESTVNGSIISNLLKKQIQTPVILQQELTNFVNNIENQKNKQIRNLKEKLEKVMKEKLRLNVVRSDLENFFLECVETVRRQIIRRKYQNKDVQNMNYYLQEIKDYSVFRVEDKMKILELLVTHEKLLIYLYQKIFPSQFNMYLQTALDKEQSILPNLNDTTQDPDQTEIIKPKSGENVARNRQKNMSFDGNLHNNFQTNMVNQSFEIGKTQKNHRKNQVSEKVQVKKGKLVFKQGQQ